MANVLVTGGAGFIGSNLVRRLINENHNVTVIDNLSTGRKENIIDVQNDIKFCHGDICDEDTVSKVLDGIDYVFHQAAIPSVQRSIDNPLRVNRSNITGTLNILWYSYKKNIKKVICAASSSAYGETPTLPKVEDMATEPLSPYAITKLASEHYTRVFYRIYKLPTVALRYFNVFGPRQDPNSEYSAVIPLFIKKMRKGEQPIIYGDGEQSRDFTYVENVVDANMLAMSKDNADGQMINVACGERISLNKLVEKLNGILKTNLKPEYAEGRPGDVKHSLADISRAKNLLGYNPRFDLENGLRELVEWFNEFDPIR